MYCELHHVLTDETYTWSTRLLRLQGWRDDQVRQAAGAGRLVRIGPASCAVGALAVAVLGSAALAALVALSSLVGVVAPNHPVETLANAVAVRRGRTPLPRNRAAKRLGCALGFVFIGGAAVAFAAGLDLLGVVLAAVIGLTAAFVAATNLCVPSAIFTLLWGAERAQAPSLVAALEALRSGRGLGL